MGGSVSHPLVNPGPINVHPPVTRGSEAAPEAGEDARGRCRRLTFLSVLVSAAVCPHPPLLVPALASGAADELDELRARCLGAVSALLEAEGDPLDVVVVGTGPTPGTAAPDATGSLAGYGVDLTVSLSRVAGSPIGGPALPLSVTLGVWLLREAGYPGVIRARVVTEHATPAECVELGARIAAFPAATALLVMGDGSARRTERAPGAYDPRAEAYDATVAAALAAADTATLGALDPELGRELLVAGRAPWQILAGAVAADGRAWKGQLLAETAPYGVDYLVASWSPA
jgi:hypothetical protein